MKKTVLALTVAVVFMFVASISSAAVNDLGSQVSQVRLVKRLVGLPQTNLSRKIRSWYSMLARLVTAGARMSLVH